MSIASWFLPLVANGIRKLRKLRIRLAAMAISNSFSSLENEKLSAQTEIEEKINTVSNDKLELKLTPEKKRITISDPLYKDLIEDTLDYFGYPYNSDSCMNKTEKIMYVYGMIAVINSLSREELLTTETLKKPLSEQVEYFCKSYYEKHGYHVIPDDTDLKLPEVYSLLKTGDSINKNDSRNSKLDNSKPEDES